MTSDDSGGPKTSLDINVGKEIDAALGDILRGLFEKPSKAVGDLVADGIGILGDRVKKKRELNAELGIEEVRKRLEVNGVSMKDITPPKEEEIHLLLSGMSLVDDEGVRGMWAGLFAKALDPNASTIAERPFITVLESLSPSDAKIIDLLAFIQRMDAEAKSNLKGFAPKDWTKITPEEQEKLNEYHKKNVDVQKEVVSLIVGKAEEYGLMSKNEIVFLDNLMRLGIIERTPVQQSRHLSAIDLSFRDEREMRRALEELLGSLQEVEEISRRQVARPEQIFTRHPYSHQLILEVNLTAFGQRFASACGLL